MMMETEILEKCNARKQKQHKILKIILDLILSLYDSMTLWLCCCTLDTSKCENTKSVEYSQ